jgi:hypothetical protein
VTRVTGDVAEEKSRLEDRGTGMSVGRTVMGRYRISREVWVSSFCLGVQKGRAERAFF